jgi:hypothetical protein
MAKVYPFGGGHLLHVQDALKRLLFEFYLDAYPKTANTFVNETNDVLKTYDHEFVAAIAGGTIVALGREMVRILLSRITASRTDEKR